ncbi:N-acetylglucosamine-1-phosphotransferase subunits alpha beta-like [Chlorella sorokiniana]|uniref:N-acetylglucosamine-1-phosphotransferase subunits alpha beta-like n=1 Tax=Chlorella sorokiniana TaxID=3076 RepID=A0A2P6TUP5_CHLSO|nr:N-acetylglucosamine-1-phosphotransferase subunits alpha beta-like [Chlorella sorokiniana]|eukprot:PRW57771.1 N-acetylglucosamine-1-phosphotransferase subunits alpha beta-like [Chlorella sorokiniana]
MRSIRHAVAMAAAAAVALAVLAPPAAAAAPDPLRLRPPGCKPDNCTSCLEYSLHADNITDSETGEMAADPCGSDGLYFPVVSWYFANCAKWFPRAWKCVPCCSAGCASDACQWEGTGAINVTAGCSACPAGTKPKMLEQYAETCRSCFQSHFCRDEVPSKWRVCEGKPTADPSPSPSPPALF